MAIEDWQVTVKAKQEEAAAKIPEAWRIPATFTDGISETASNNVLHVPRECGVLTVKQLDITENYDATALLEKIHSKHFTATEVTEAFCIRAAIAQQVVSWKSVHSQLRSVFIWSYRPIVLQRHFSIGPWKEHENLTSILRILETLLGPCMVFQLA